MSAVFLTLASSQIKRSKRSTDCMVCQSITQQNNLILIDMWCFSIKAESLLHLMHLGDYNNYYNIHFIRWQKSGYISNVDLCNNQFARSHFQQAFPCSEIGKSSLWRYPVLRQLLSNILYTKWALVFVKRTN